MRVLVLGASGGVGRQLVAEAVAAGHAVRALVRGEPPAPGVSGVQWLRGDVLDPAALAGAVAGVDAVLSALGMRRRAVANPWSAILGSATFNSESATAIVAAMRAAGVGRVVAVSAAGVGDSAPAMNAVMRGLVATSSIGVAYRDLATMEGIFASSGLDVLLPRPTRLTDGPATGRVRVTASFGAWDAISRADVARWMVGALGAPVWPPPGCANPWPQITGA